MAQLVVGLPRCSTPNTEVIVRRCSDPRDVEILTVWLGRICSWVVIIEKDRVLAASSQVAPPDSAQRLACNVVVLLVKRDESADVMVHAAAAYFRDSLLCNEARDVSLVKKYRQIRGVA